MDTIPSIVSVCRVVVSIRETRVSKRFHRETYPSVIVRGVTLEECKSNWEYQKCFPFKDRKKPREMQKAGLVTLVSIEIIQYPGIQKPGITQLLDELI